MSCSEILDPDHSPKHVEFENYAGLHPEGRNLIFDWFQRAWTERNCSEEDSFGPFIFVWFAFNGWAPCVTDKDSDRDIIDALAADPQINSDFADAVDKADSNVALSIKRFASFLPIFDVRSLRRSGILQLESADRSLVVEHYFDQGADRFEPRCAKQDRNLGEEIPLDWAHMINGIYKVRCNLFHGLKAAHSEMDRRIVSAAFLALVHFLSETGYLVV